MKSSELNMVCEEARAHLVGKVIGRFFQLGRTSFAVDFLPHAGLYLFVDFSFQHSTTFLIRRRRKELERSSLGKPRLLVKLQQELQDLQVLDVECSPRASLIIRAGAE